MGEDKSREVECLFWKWWAAGVVLDFAANPAPIVRERPAMVGKMDGVLINVRKNKQKFAARIKAGRARSARSTRWKVMLRS